MIAKVYNFCVSRRTGTALAIGAVLAFVILSLVRTYPINTYQDVVNCVGDDWGTYARYALDIKNNGILLLTHAIPYHSPAGFLYNYFLALSLAIFGEKVFPIYVAQHLMLGLSVALIYWTFRDKMRKLTGLVFLCTLFFFALKDVYKNYSCLLLSENLALFFIALFFFCFVKGFEKNKSALQIMAAVFLGLSILTRANIALFGATLMPVIATFYLKRGKRGFVDLALFLLVLVASASFLLMRNYFLCGQIAFLPTHGSFMKFTQIYHSVPPSVDLSRVAESFFCTKLHFSLALTGYIEYALQQPAVFLGHYWRKVIFCLGFLHSLTPYYGTRMHWVIMWVGYGWYTLPRIKYLMKWEMWEVSTQLFILTYYGSVIMAAPIHYYGFRMLIPVISFVLVLAFMGADKVWSAVTNLWTTRIKAIT